MRSTVVAETWGSDENIPNSLGDVEQARELLIELGERGRGEQIKVALDRAAKRSGLTHSRAFDFWYRKAKTIDQTEADAIRAAVVKRRREIARQEFSELRNRMARLEAMLAQSDPEFHLGTIQEIRGQLHQ